MSNPTFDRSGLESLDERLFSLADRVVPMRDIYKGDVGRRVIGLRHDVDDNPGAFDTAVAMAEWEFARGYSSTYFLLHGSRYWDSDHLVRALLFEELGHEVGIHVNALAEALRVRRSPDWILCEALGDLRAFGLRVEGCAAHGDALCRGADGNVRFVNDEMFKECRRYDMGESTRTISHKKTSVQIEPRPLATYHLTYDANWLPRGNYLSDSGKTWSQELNDVTATFGDGQLHVLIHPDWWADAFVGAVV
jgi:hypothetical protein